MIDQIYAMYLFWSWFVNILNKFWLHSIWLLLYYSTNLIKSRMTLCILFHKMLSYCMCNKWKFYPYREYHKSWDFLSIQKVITDMIFFLNINGNKEIYPTANSHFNWKCKGKVIFTLPRILATQEYVCNKLFLCLKWWYINPETIHIPRLFITRIRVRISKHSFRNPKRVSERQKLLIHHL